MVGNSAPNSASLPPSSKEGNVPASGTETLFTVPKVPINPSAAASAEPELYGPSVNTGSRSSGISAAAAADSKTHASTNATAATAGTNPSSTTSVASAASAASEGEATVSDQEGTTVFFTTRSISIRKGCYHSSSHCGNLVGAKYRIESGPLNDALEHHLRACKTCIAYRAH